MASRFHYMAVSMEGTVPRAVQGELVAEDKEAAMAELKRQNLLPTGLRILPPEHSFGQGDVPVFWFTGVAATGRSCDGLVEAQDTQEASQLLRAAHIYVDSPRAATGEERARGEAMVRIRQGEVCLPEEDVSGLAVLVNRICWIPCEMQGSHGWVSGELSLGDGVLVFSKRHEQDDRLEDCWRGEVKGASIRSEGLFRKRVRYRKDGNEASFRGEVKRIMTVLEFAQREALGKLGDRSD